MMMNPARQIVEMHRASGWRDITRGLTLAFDIWPSLDIAGKVCKGGALVQGCILVRCWSTAQYSCTRFPATPFIDSDADARGAQQASLGMPAYPTPEEKLDYKLHDDLSLASIRHQIPSCLYSVRSDLAAPSQPMP